MNDDIGYLLEGLDCNQCLCDALKNNRTFVFTCTNNQSENVICQFYYFMPKLDEIIHPINDTNVYVLKNETFEQKDDCCNTTYLIQNIRESLPSMKNFTTKKLRTLHFGDNNTILTVDSDTGNLLIFNKTTLEMIYESTSISSIVAAGYHENNYYLATTRHNIDIYDRALNTILDTVVVGNPIKTIRFHAQKRMLVGATTDGVRIYSRKSNGVLAEKVGHALINNGQQLHAIGVVNHTSFYSGLSSGNTQLPLHFETRSGNWMPSIDEAIPFTDSASDIVVDDCGRVWIVQANGNNLFIYDRTEAHLHSISVDNDKLFNLLILENYTLLMSHQSDFGLSRIELNLNCRSSL